jgi:hypothetical protein
MGTTAGLAAAVMPPTFCLLLGLGGDILITDDLNHTAEEESDADRAAVENFWREFSSTLLNNPRKAPAAHAPSRCIWADPGR